MRIPLDESLPWELQSELPGHTVRTVQQQGWSSLKNVELLSRSVGRFDAFVTADQNLQYQQDLKAPPIAVVVLVAKTNRMRELRPLIPELRARRRLSSGSPAIMPPLMEAERLNLLSAKLEDLKKRSQELRRYL